ncbi:hypothetical protein [Clostridium sp. DL1XJH146]
MMLSKESIFELIIIAIIVQAVLLLALIIVQKRKDKKINETMESKHFNQNNIVVSFIWFMFSIYSMIIFLGGYIKYYSFFIPKYLTKWYYMLSYKHIQQIDNILSQDMDNMWREAIKVYSFEFGLKYFYFGILFLMNSIIFYHIAAHKNQINNDGVYSGRSLYKWDDIKEFIWEKYPNKILISRYYKLTFSIPRDKPVKWFQFGEIKELSIYVKLEDKDNVNDFIKVRI